MKPDQMYWKLRLLKIRTGSAKELAGLLTDDEFGWLLNQVPKGGSLMLAISGLVSDAYAEDVEDKNVR